MKRKTSNSTATRQERRIKSLLKENRELKALVKRLQPRDIIFLEALKINNDPETNT